MIEAWYRAVFGAIESMWEGFWFAWLSPPKKKKDNNDD